MKKIIYVLAPLVGGIVVGLLNMSGMKNYDGLVPSFIFPIVWNILYVLMGLSSYLVKDNDELINLYKVNLVVNYAWVFIFFTFNLRVIGFIWILLLIGIVSLMIKKYYKYNKVSAYLLIPYLIWLILASVLNIMAID